MDSELKNKFDISKLDESLTYFQTILKQIKDIQTSISNYNLELENNNYPLTLKLLPKIEDKLKKFSQTQQKFPELKIEFLENYFSQINSWISNEKNLKPKKRQHYVDSFFNQMGDHFKSCNLPLNGHNPTFSSKNFKFILDSNKLKINIVYGGDEEKMHLFDGLSLTDVSSTIKNFYEYFDKLELSLELKIIHDCYLQCIQKNNQSTGEWILINDIMKSYVEEKSKSQLKLQYPDRIHFSFLIFKIFKSEILYENKRIGKRTATHSAAVNKNEHIWLPLGTDDLMGENIMYLNFN